MKFMRNDMKIIREDLTAADIKALEDFKDISNELAQQLADSIRIYTEIIYKCYMENRLGEQKAKIIQLNPAQAKKTA